MPSEMPKVKKKKEEEIEREMKSNETVEQGAWQMWHTNGTRCPKGTVPIRRSSVYDVLRAKSLFDFGKKRRSIYLSRRIDAPDVISSNGHEVCYLFFFYFTHFPVNCLRKLIRPIINNL